MSGRSDEVFVIEGGDLRPLPARPWRDKLFGKDLEDALHKVIEKQPNVLPGRQMDPGSDNPPRFVLLCHEIPSGGGSLDLLLVDQRGVLTLVEAKLIANSEARRAVIGQIIEYAASAVESWGNGRARAKAVEFWSKRRQDLDDLLCKEFGWDPEDLEEVEAFWLKVEENLQQGQIRLIIAADELRSEVRRMIEYLNGEMRRARIYGVELRRYGKEAGFEVLVPTLVGQMQATEALKPPPEVTLWSVERLQGAYDNLEDATLRQRLQRVLDWAQDRGVFLEARAQNPTFGLRGRSGRLLVSFFSNGHVYCYLSERRYPGGSEERDQLVAELRTLGMYPGDLDPRDVVSGRNLARKLTELREGELSTLLEVFSHFCGTPERA